MIHVIATIEMNDGRRGDFLKAFHANVDNVLAEDGCLAYGPTVDVKADIGVQVPIRDNVVTVVEQWASLDTLHAHLAAPHMATYRDQVKDIVKGVTLQVLEPA